MSLSFLFPSLGKASIPRHIPPISLLTKTSFFLSIPFSFTIYFGEDNLINSSQRIWTTTSFIVLWGYLHLGEGLVKHKSLSHGLKFEQQISGSVMEEECRDRRKGVLEGKNMSFWGPSSFLVCKPLSSGESIAQLKIQPYSSQGKFLLSFTQ